MIVVDQPSRSQPGTLFQVDLIASIADNPSVQNSEHCQVASTILLHDLIDGLGSVEVFEIALISEWTSRFYI